MKTWFITGTSSGFGRIMSERLLERGDHVVATLRRPARSMIYGRVSQPTS